MADAKLLQVNHTAVRHVVSVDDTYLNRFWDDSELPRQESHLEDVELAEASARDPEEIYRDIRAAASAPRTGSCHTNYARHVRPVRSSRR